MESRPVVTKPAKPMSLKERNEFFEKVDNEAAAFGFGIVIALCFLLPLFVNVYNMFAKWWAQ